MLPRSPICVCASNLRRRGAGEFHGYDIAKRLGDGNNHRLLTAYGTLYRALGRLEAISDERHSRSRIANETPDRLECCLCIGAR